MTGWMGPRPGMRLAAKILSLALLIAPWGVRADIPETIAYQGFLTDGQGSPINGTVKLTFRLYDALTNGTQIWTEVHDSVEVLNGVFIAKLGSVTKFRGLSEDDYLLFNQPYFLSTEVNSDTEMAPRLELTGAPYAFAGPRFTEVTIDCTDGDPVNHESIQQILNEAPITPFFLVINIDGVCEQRVFIGRDHVVIRGRNLNDTEPGGRTVLTPPVHGISGIPKLSTDNESTVIRVRGASNVFIDNLKIQTLASVTDDSRGVVVYDGGAATVDNSQFSESDYGVFATRSSFIRVRNSTVESNTYAILAMDGADVWIENCTLQVNATETDIAGTLAAFRQNAIRLRRTNSVLNGGDDNDPNTSADNGNALFLFHHVHLRQDGGHTTIKGRISTGTLTNTSLRDAHVIGSRIDVFTQSGFDMRPSLDTTFPDELGGSPEIHISGDSSFSLTGVQGSVGRIQASGDSRISFGSRTVSGTPHHTNLNANSTVTDNALRAFDGSTIDVNSNTVLDLQGNINIGDKARLGIASGASVTSASGHDLGFGAQTNLSGQLSVTGFSGDENSLLRISGANAKLTVTGEDGLFTRGLITLCCNENPAPELEASAGGLFLLGGQLALFGSLGPPAPKVTLTGDVNLNSRANLHLDSGTLTLNSGNLNVQDNSEVDLRDSTTLNVPGDVYIGGHSTLYAIQATIDIGGNLSLDSFVSARLSQSTVTADSMDLCSYVVMSVDGTTTHPASLSTTGNVNMGNDVRLSAFSQGADDITFSAALWSVFGSGHINWSTTKFSGDMHIGGANNSVHFGDTFTLQAGTISCDAPFVISLDNAPIIEPGAAITCDTSF